MKFPRFLLLGLVLACLTPPALAAQDNDGKHQDKRHKVNKDQAEMLEVTKEKKQKKTKKTKEGNDHDGGEHGDHDDDGDYENARKTKSNDTAAEMIDRKAERKAIKEDYKAAGVKQKGKKPWWKFWEGEKESIPQNENE